MKIFLKFIYTGTVHDDWKNNARELTDMAARFSLPSLKNFIDMNLDLNCNVENAIDMLQIAQCYAFKMDFKNITKYIHVHK